MQTRIHLTDENVDIYICHATPQHKHEIVDILRQAISAYAPEYKTDQESFPYDPHMWREGLD